MSWGRVGAQPEGTGTHICKARRSEGGNEDNAGDEKGCHNAREMGRVRSGLSVSSAKKL